MRLFERASRPGGLAGGQVIDGQVVDFGSHRLHPSIDPDILEDLRTLLGGILQERPRHGRIRLGSAWLDFPLQARQLLTTLSPPILARLTVGAVVAMTRPRRDETFESAVTTGLGRAMGELFYFPYARKIWGLDPAELSGEQARRRIGAATPLELARKALSSSASATFWYPETGFGAIPQAIASAAVAAGADLRLGSTVTGVVETAGDGWQVVTGDGRHRARMVLSTVPVGPLTTMLGPPPEVADAAARLESRAMVLVYLTVAGERWTEFDAHYFPYRSVPFTRISEPKNYRSSTTDPSSSSVLCVEMPCAVGDTVWAASDRDLADVVRDGVVAVGLPDPGRKAVVTRLPHAYPVYRRGVERHLETVFSWLDQHDGVVTFGRQGLFAHDNTHHALVMARDAVACVRDDLSFDRAAWDEARARFADHVVED